MVLITKLIVTEALWTGFLAFLGGYRDCKAVNWEHESTSGRCHRVLSPHGQAGSAWRHKRGTWHKSSLLSALLMRSLWRQWHLAWVAWAFVRKALSRTGAISTNSSLQSNTKITCDYDWSIFFWRQKTSTQSLMFWKIKQQDNVHQCRDLCDI